MSCVTCHVTRHFYTVAKLPVEGLLSTGPTPSSLLYKQLSKDLNLIRNLQSPSVLKLQLVKYLNFFLHIYFNVPLDDIFLAVLNSPRSQVVQWLVGV